MRINLTFYTDTDKDRLTIKREISDILKKTADYQRGDITLNSEHSNVFGDSVDANFYIKEFNDMGHTRGTLSELFKYLQKEFL